MGQTDDPRQSPPPPREREETRLMKIYLSGPMREGLGGIVLAALRARFDERERTDANLG